MKINFRDNVFEGFERQNLFVGNSLFRVVLDSDGLTQDCPICMGNEYGGVAAICACGHKFHASCLRPIMLSSLPGARLCPTCRTPLLVAELGIPVPVVPPLAEGVQNLGGQHNVVLNQVFVNIGNQFSLLGEQRERVLFPLMLEAVKVPVLDAALENNQIQDLLFYGRVPLHVARRYRWKKVPLIPGLVAELSMFWLHRDRNYDNYCLSVLRCRELLRKVTGIASFLEYNMQYAPIAALYRSQGAIEVAILANPNVVPDVGINWKKLLVIFMIIIMLCVSVPLMIGGIKYWNEKIAPMSDPRSMHRKILEEIFNLNEEDAYME